MCCDGTAGSNKVGKDLMSSLQNAHQRIDFSKVKFCSNDDKPVFNPVFSKLDRKSFFPHITIGWVNEQATEFVFNNIENKMNNSLQFSLGNPGWLLSLNFTCIIGN